MYRKATTTAPTTESPVLSNVAESAVTMIIDASMVPVEANQRKRLPSRSTRRPAITAKNRFEIWRRLFRVRAHFYVENRTTHAESHADEDNLLV
jgi:hypothetical protein